MKKILVVDDDPVMLHVMTRLLSKQYAIVSASSGTEALDLFDLERPDLVLSDLRMPGMDGYELRCHLRKKSDVPFIFMTADESDESERKGLDIGAADYIRKPANADVLLRRIGNIMQNVERIHGLKEAASIDGMTQLLNKETAQREIAKLCRRVPGALLMLDLDSFKLVNDLYGHDTGDRILIRLSELIKGMIRSTDLAGRLGGDEFIAYLQHVKDESIIREKTQYLNEELMRSAKEYMGEDMDIPLGASGGVVFVPAEGTDFAELYKKADQALYKAKSAGKHGVVFHGATHPTGSAAARGKGMSHVRQILGERNIEKGALLLDFNRFRAVYRFLSRQDMAVLKRTQFLQLTLQEDVSQETAEQFRDMLQHSLRHSDCIMQNNTTQFFVLLVDAEKEHGEIVKQRIHDRWAGLPESSHCSYACEMECIGEP